MDPITLTESIKKHGATTLLVVALLWMNNRLSEVEEKLYDCLENRVSADSGLHKRHHNIQEMVAILPDRIKIVYA